MNPTRRPANDPADPAARPVAGVMGRSAFWLMLRRVALVAGGVDVLLFVLFSALHMPLLAWMNVVSIAMYAAAYRLLGRRRNLPAVLLMWCEVLVHSGACTVLLGWDSGVHYFMMVFIPAIAVGRSPRQTALALGFLLLVYLGVNAAATAVQPVYALSPRAALTLRWFSIATVFLMFGYIGRYYVQRVAEAELRLRELAARDALSGLANRRQMTLSAEVELERAKREGEPLAVLLADIDRFKRVNDRWGHAAGDRLIQHVAALMVRSLRPTDVVGRWGGEEFIALLPATTLDEAMAIAERLRAAIAEGGFEVDGAPIPVTVSVGVHAADGGRPFGEAVAAADAAMYRAKEGGRDAVVGGPPSHMPA